MKIFFFGKSPSIFCGLIQNLDILKQKWGSEDSIGWLQTSNSTSTLFKPSMSTTALFKPLTLTAVLFKFSCQPLHYSSCCHCQHCQRPKTCTFHLPRKVMIISLNKKLMARACLIRFEGTHNHSSQNFFKSVKFKLITISNPDQ